MFSGIVHSQGIITTRVEKTGLVHFKINAPDLTLSHKAIGNSIAVNGCCLTVTENTASDFSVDCGVETLKHTNLGELVVGSVVNLEPALTLQTALHGHLVSGHVDGIAVLEKIENVGESILIDVKVPAALQRYMVEKGSVALNGVSLTIAARTPKGISLMIIPHTWHVTTFQYLKVGAHLNIEVDMIARYVERLIKR